LGDSRTEVPHENAAALAKFWSDVTGYTVESSNEDFGLLVNPDGTGPNLMFAKVPEPRTGKNRMHVDRVVPDMATEVERIVAFGARTVAYHEEYGIKWTVLADSEGNEFCVGQH
jgi:predicted enzyme related to lactoylglutathione lyase